MQFGSGSNTLWPGTLRLKDGFLPVIYQGDPDDGADDATIFWQGDTSKPYQDDPQPAPGETRQQVGWKAGYAKAYEVASSIMTTFITDGIEAAAKKVGA